MSIKERTPESREHYQRYLHSYGYDTTYSYQLKAEYMDSLSVYPFALNTYKLEHNGKASPIQVRVYNSKGALVNAYEQCFGDMDKLGILDSVPFKKISHLPINYSLSFSKDINLFISDPVSKKKLEDLVSKKEFTFVIYYVIYGGYYSNITLKKMRKHLRTKLPYAQIITVNASPDRTK